MSDDIHDQLTKAYLEYFKANEKFESKVSYRTHASSRRWLRKIRELSKDRMDEIHLKFEAKKAAKKQKAQ